MVSSLGKLTLAVTDLTPVRKLFTETRPGRALSTRFVAGETVDEAIAVARRLNADGASVSLDHLGEHVADRDQALAAAADYMALLDRMRGDSIDGNISIKLTQLGLGTDDELAADSLDLLATHAAELAMTVTIDMEESRYTAKTIDMFAAAQAAHGNLGVAIQAYLRRSPADLARVIAAGGHVRICKGAYAEPDDVAYQAGDEVNRAFDSMVTLAMAAPWIEPAIATHDGGRVDHALECAAGRAEPWEFQLLYGVRPALQRRLVSAGHTVRIYVPYGVAWYPYLTRRLAERPANLTFFLRALLSRS